MSDYKEVHCLPSGEVVDFYPNTHIYSVRGVEVPSVTTLVQKEYGNQYAGVNPEILQRAADHGTAVHKELQEWIETRKRFPEAEIISAFSEVQNYFTYVEPVYHIIPKDTERVVVLYDSAGVPCAAGRFDLLCTVAGAPTLADFKTTSSIHRTAVTAQLNLYARAAAQSGYIPSEEIQLGVIHLSGSTARFVPIVKLNPSFYLKFIH